MHEAKEIQALAQTEPRKPRYGDSVGRLGYLLRLTPRRSRSQVERDVARPSSYLQRRAFPIPPWRPRRVLSRNRNTLALSQFRLHHRQGRRRTDDDRIRGLGFLLGRYASHGG